MTDEELIAALRKVGTTNGHDNSVALRAADRLSALSPRVKPLEWPEMNYEAARSYKGELLCTIRCAPILGLKHEQPYRITYAQLSDERREISPLCHEFPRYELSGWKWENFATLEEAKAAAQADYERRIMSAIEVSASPRVVTDEMVERACMANINPLSEPSDTERRHMRAALEAALPARPVVTALTDEQIDRFWPECRTASGRAILKAEWDEFNALSALEGEGYE